MTTAEEYRDKRWWALALLCMTQFMVVLDASIVNIALPSIGTDLEFSQENLSWVINGYVLTFGGFLLLGGRMADLLGRRRVFMGGLIVIAVASLAAGFASTEGQLIAARAAQGLGAAIISPAALSLVTTLFTDGSERNKALGAWGAVAGSGGAVGTLLGGVLTDGLGWEWVLWVNVPVALVVLALTPRLVAESRSTGEHRTFDVAGAVTVTSALSILVYALVDAADAGWGSTPDARPDRRLGGAVRDLRRDRAALEGAAGPLQHLQDADADRRQRRRAAGRRRRCLSMFFFITLYMQQVLGYSPIEAGLAYLPLSTAIIVSAGVASQLVTKIGFKPVLMIGMVVVAVGLLLVQPGRQSTAPTSPTSSARRSSPAIGLGLTFVPTTIAAVSGVRERESGLASGLINTSQQLGGALGLAVLATIANSRTEDVLGAAGGDPAQQALALTDGFQIRVPRRSAVRASRGWWRPWC